MAAIIGVEINVPGIGTAIVDLENNAVRSETHMYDLVDTLAPADDLIAGWAAVIHKTAGGRLSKDTLIGLAIPGPFDYEAGISLMHDRGKFNALYKQNVREMLAGTLDIPPANIRMANNAPCFLTGEVLAGAALGYKKVLAFTLNHGLGSAIYENGAAKDANLWNQPYKDGIAEDYVGINWITKRYEEFTGLNISDIRELTRRAQTDDGIGQLVFNEYGENFVKFLLQYIPFYNPHLILIGGHSHAWELFIDHVIDRLGDKGIQIPILAATLGDDAALIGAAHLWG